VESLTLLPLLVLFHFSEYLDVLRCFKYGKKCKRVQAALSPQHVFQNRSRTRHNPLPTAARRPHLFVAIGLDRWAGDSEGRQRVVPGKKSHAFSTLIALLHEACVFGRFSSEQCEERAVKTTRNSNLA